MKVIKEERIFLKRNLTVAFKEVSCIGSKAFLSKGTNPIEKKVIFLDDYIVFEPAKNFPGGKEQEYISNNSSDKTVKYVIVKTKYLDTFNETLLHYFQLTKQKYKSLLVKQFILLRNGVILIKLGKCTLKGFPNNLSLQVKEIKAQLDATFGKITDPSLTKVLVRGQIKEIKNKK